MSTEMTKPGLKSKTPLWASWGAIVVVAILAGVLLPQLMPAEMVLEKSAAKVEVKEKGSLEYTAPSLPDAPNSQAMLVRLGMGTALVLGLCVFTLWGMRRWLNPQGTAGASVGELKLIETLPLGNRCSLHLVHLGKQNVLVGVDATGIKTIVPLPGTFDDMLAEAETGSPGTIPFPEKKLESA